MLILLLLGLQRSLIMTIHIFGIGLKEHSYIIKLLIGFAFFPYLFFSENSHEIKLVAIFSYFLILILEIVNIVIEKICNRLTLDYDEQIKTIKDISSAAVLLL